MARASSVAIKLAFAGGNRYAAKSVVGTQRNRALGESHGVRGSHAEDGTDGPQPDRNFPHGWKEHDPASGAVPLSEPEARALAEFVLARPELFAVLVVGAQEIVPLDPP